jgi:hypothetical protein
MVSIDIKIRTATHEDCAVILHHRRRMFEDMKEGSAQDLDRMVEASAPWLERALADGSYRGWLAESADRKVVAGGGVLISSWPAGPRDHYARRALIINVGISSPESGSAAYVVDDSMVEGPRLQFGIAARER